MKSFLVCLLAFFEVSQVNADSSLVMGYDFLFKQSDRIILGQLVSSKDEDQKQGNGFVIYSRDLIFSVANVVRGEYHKKTFETSLVRVRGEGPEDKSQKRDPLISSIMTAQLPDSQKFEPSTYYLIFDVKGVIYFSKLPGKEIQASTAQHVNRGKKKREDLEGDKVE